MLICHVLTPLITQQFRYIVDYGIVFIHIFMFWQEKTYEKIFFVLM